MSLVNLAHVCSHLQNASLARLGLTSIPYTKLHLSLSLILQKQGFISQVSLGGPSPPASCFARSSTDEEHLQRAAARDTRSPEVALALRLREGRDGHWLRANGFGEEAVDFAEEHHSWSLQELEAQGWAEEVVQFILAVRNKIDTTVEQRKPEFDERRSHSEHSTDADAELDLEHRPYKALQFEVEAEVLSQLPPTHQEIYKQHQDMTDFDLKYPSFSYDTLAGFAGPRAYKTENDIARHGITLSVMGLQIHNQPLTLPNRLSQPKDYLDDEGVVTQQNRASRRLWLGLKYYESKPVISKARMVSKPTKRIWLSSQELGKVVRGKQAGEVKGMAQIGEIMAISTDRGIMEARECVERRIGGQALCRVW